MDSKVIRRKSTYNAIAFFSFSANSFLWETMPVMEWTLSVVFCIYFDSEISAMRHAHEGRVLMKNSRTGDSSCLRFVTTAKFEDIRTGCIRNLVSRKQWTSKRPVLWESMNNKPIHRCSVFTAPYLPRLLLRSSCSTLLPVLCKKSP